MTLIEAIEHCKDMAKCEYGECAEEHRQLAEWLMELHDIKTHGKRTETHGVRSEKQVTGKLKNGEDPLVRADNEGSKEQKSKLDLISRQDVYDALEQYDREHVEPVGYDDYYNGFLHILESLPSADRATGEWIKTEHCLCDTGYRRWIEIECPFCGERPTYEFLENMKYCPNCGAKMKGGEEE